MELNDIYYNCTECSSIIEILSIDEQNNTIEFKCINKDKNHKIKININDYLEKMKKYNNKNINKDTCNIHNNKYITFCINCNIHLCNECLRTKKHINHIKNNIIEIQSSKDELKIVEEIINHYDERIENLTSEQN